ncbi:MAG: MBL fold metallo-hydrolase [Myxococcota bacterium]
MSRWALAAFLLCLGCATTPQHLPGSPPITLFRLPISNVWLVKSATPILIDSGAPGDLPALEASLAGEGLSPADIRLVIVTHAHADHAATAAAFQARGAKVVLGAGDVEQARAGKNDLLKPIGFSANLIRPAIPDEFPGFSADIAVEKSPFDLKPYGLEAKVVAMPGHTKGSLVVLLDDGRAFVGDLLAGGFFGGILAPGRAGEHYYHADKRANHRNIEAMMKRGTTTYYPGHGGPIEAAAVAEAFKR